MAGRLRKVSFVLQFANSGDSPAGEPRWRATLEEVESGARQTFVSYEALAVSLARYGISFPHEKPADQICGACRTAARRAREAS